MGADNWAVCPKCRITARAALAKKESELAKAYGMIPAEDFVSQQQALKRETEKFEDPQSFREDYSIGVDEHGEFIVRYAGSCENCGLSYTFGVAKKVPLSK